MPVSTTLRTLDFAEALDLVDEGAAFVDLRDIQSYLEVHIPGSLPLLYEFGPGMASRARDCLPLSLRLVILDHGGFDVANAAASLRGKGFEVLGKVDDGINQWARARGVPASTEVLTGGKQPEGLVLDVGDPEAGVVEGAARIQVESLWSRVPEVTGRGRILVLAGRGVRAALAGGILERGGAREIVFWKTGVSPLPSPSR